MGQKVNAHSMLFSYLNKGKKLLKHNKPRMYKEKTEKNYAFLQ